MNKFHPLMWIVLTTILVTLVVPSILVLSFSNNPKHINASAKQDLTNSNDHTDKNQAEPSIDVSVYRTMTKEIENIPLEEYVAGVVASEMPVSFEPEALKAQSLAARTFLVKQMLSPSKINLPEGTDITDSIQYHQIFKNKEELASEWGKDYQANLSKVQKAVDATKGQIITYDEKPIDASFFSTSNGYTENSEDYWGNETPYLKSVDSPWDLQSPKFQNQTSIPVPEFEELLGTKLNNDVNIGTILSKSEGNRIKFIEISDKKYSGKAIRNKLKLNSSDFTFKREGNKVIINTRGNGHGVGMSQYGANGLAMEGKNYKDIVHYYYQDVTISSVEPFINKMYVKK
ncbi:stage II sporulation protein D [Peribacillus muralis]|uniref:Stage II sporulation protein D n=1 Tax=Peribacillus muralis TaxID=264697 RepID=A0A1B3XTP0_9BACI|nr:stage II sporulation protein D [Peribacillus muralis]AOH56558.1 stage II sporulation protein D [Peribacillus muralis]